MIGFFSNKKYKVYALQVKSNGAGDSVDWVECRNIKAYIEPVNGENLLASEEGSQTKISLIIYTQNLIHTGERLYIPDKNENGGWFEIQQREFYKLPFFNYYKGYLVKIDENIRI